MSCWASLSATAIDALRFQVRIFMILNEEITPWKIQLRGEAR